MPSKRDFRSMMVQFEPDLHAEFAALALSNGRSFKDELQHAMRRHLARPPVVRVVVEEVAMEPTEIDAGKASKKRGPKPKTRED